MCLALARASPAAKSVGSSASRHPSHLYRQCATETCASPLSPQCSRRSPPPEHRDPFPVFLSTDTEGMSLPTRYRSSLAATSPDIPPRPIPQSRLSRRPQHLQL